MITNLQSVSYSNRMKPVSKPSFKGAEAIALPGLQALRFLNNSPAIGACFVDLASMVVPRTALDTKQRGLDAGIETGARESVSTVNHAIVGEVGLAAGTALALGLNQKYKNDGIQANKIFVNGESIDLLSSVWKNSNSKTDFYKTLLSSMQGLNKGEWKGLSEKCQNDVAEALANKAIDKETKTNLIQRIMSETGAEGQYKIEIPKSTKISGGKISDSLDVLLSTMDSLGKSFAKKTGDEFEVLVKDLKNHRRNSALLGLAVSCAIGCSAQPINAYLTKKRTGKDGFVGVENRTADKSDKFKFLKVAASAAMGVFALGCIDHKPSKILNKIQFTQRLPNMDQYKLLYGATIMSRFMSSRDGNELRESVIKDSLGFVNWLILGGMVTKIAARVMPGGKELINSDLDKAASGGKLKYAWNWITKANVKSYDEVLVGGAKEAIKSKIKNGEKVAFKELWKEADKVSKGKVGKLAAAQLIGYLYSGIVLGLGIAKLNIFVTNKVQKDKKPAANKTSDAKFYAQKQQSEKPIFAKIKD